MATINLNHLHYFFEVARRGSFTRAARELLVSQSALSVQVRALENALGGTLFDRRRNGVVLTDAGQRAYEVAERVFAEVDRLVADFQKTEPVVSASVTVCTVNSIGIYVLPDLLTAFRAHAPEVRIRLDFRESERAMDQLYQGKADMVVVPWERAYPDLTGVPLTRNKMFLVAPPDHPLVSAARPVPRDLEAYPFVGYSEGMHTRSMIDALFRRMSLKIEYSVESSNAATIKQMVIAGMGLGFLPETAVAADIRRGVLARLDVPPLVMSQDVTLYLRKNRTLPRAAGEFADFLRDYFAPGKRVARKRGA
ncbi:MAG: LysR family transcriptional regulator [Candidatus Krumholzibacteria bacterium]|nr:LysR family transcriptional regulator [Candidatus Krumholzibacteria bacterium]MDH4336567.1 LysR family transcriptional regulator [Candidatus Krumholzibacteria bacterium]MDH5269648.1 LysR family transcriptional regulator [Candidatus Krumholzibacteria bacterium]MDH5626798.1 LysR family transcriptional regulator [Candidatus Krumholzibacteria bacterium]